MIQLKNLILSIHPIIWVPLVYYACDLLVELGCDENVKNDKTLELLPFISAIAAGLYVDHLKGKLNRSRKRNNRRKRMDKLNKNPTLSTSGDFLMAIPYKHNSPISTMPDFYYNLENAFEQLADILKPPDRFLNAVRRDAHDVFELLKTNAAIYGIKIDRTIIAGSIGKGTGIWFRDETGKLRFPDLDCVGFVNGEKPPFIYTLGSFESILEDHDVISNIRTTKRAVQFLYEDAEYGTIKFDLLPATNYVTKPLRNGQNIGKVQARLALKDVTRKLRCIQEGQTTDINEINKLHSSGLNENTVQRISDIVADDFTAKGVRLAKYWNAQIVMDKSLGFPARSCIIELIAICAQNKRGAGRRSLIAEFVRFLELMADFGRCRVYLPPTTGLRNKNNQLATFRSALALTMANGPSSPVVIEPSNGNYNLAEGIKPEAVKIFEARARQTLKIFQRLGSRQDYENAENAIDEIFLA